MSNLIFSLIHLPRLTTGRRLFALRHVREKVVAIGDKPLLALVDDAITHETRTVTMERAWPRSKAARAPGDDAAVLNHRIDGTLGAIHAILANNAAVLPSDSAVAAASQTLLGQLFQKGARPSLTRSFEARLVENDRMIERLTGDLVDAVAAASITHYVDRLQALNARFGAELKKWTGKPIRFDELEASRDTGNLNLRRITAVVLGRFSSDSDADAALRRTLLGPILDQCARVRRKEEARQIPEAPDSSNTADASESGEEGTTDEAFSE